MSKKAIEKKKPTLGDMVKAAHEAGVKLSFGLVPKAKPEGFTALHPGFRIKVWYGFRDGESVASLRKKYSLSQVVVEEIIRAHLKAPNIYIERRNCRLSRFMF